jgi:hypothetical protein
VSPAGVLACSERAVFRGAGSRPCGTGAIPRLRSGQACASCGQQEATVAPLSARRTRDAQVARLPARVPAPQDGAGPVVATNLRPTNRTRSHPLREAVQGFGDDETRPTASRRLTPIHADQSSAPAAPAKQPESASERSQVRPLPFPGQGARGALAATSPRTTHHEAVPDRRSSASIGGLPASGGFQRSLSPRLNSYEAIWMAGSYHSQSNSVTLGSCSPPAAR